MFDKLYIYNGALSRIGEKTRISSEGEKSIPKVECDTHFPMVLDQLLIEYQFSCSQKQESLTRTNKEGIEEFKNCFALPSDFVSAVKLNNRERFKIIGNYFYANIDNPVLLYAARITDLSVCNASIIECIILLLASKIAFSLTQNPSLSQGLLVEYSQIALPAAKMNDIQGQSFCKKQKSGWAAGITEDFDIFWGDR